MRIRHPGAWIAGGIFILVVFLLVFVFRVFDQSAKHSRNHPDYPAIYGAQMFEDETPAPGTGNRHLNPGEMVRYNSNPPTNGRHASGAVPWGVSPTPVNPAEALHNMEHGGVVVWYNCDGGAQPLDEASCDQLIGDLIGVVQPRAEDGMFIVLVPYSQMENRISLTAWQYLDSFDDFNKERIEAFIASFECRYDPEGACR